MNYRLVLKTYTALRQMSPDDLALLDTLRGLSDTEREMMMEALNPTKGTGKGLKRTTKKRGKSQRATGMAAAIGDSLQRSRAASAASTDDVSDGTPCMDCIYRRDHNIHHLNTDPDYHEFVATAQSAAVASGG